MIENKDEILHKAKTWFKESIAKNHIKNTEKLKKSSKFNINPFLAVYLSNFLTGNSSAENIAKALILPRVLGTSITTSFGQNIQSFTSSVLSAFGSAVSGIDIEFIDQIDNRKKYCQLKSGPNTINKDDVETVSNHFRAIKNLARTNNLEVNVSDLVVGVIYGERNALSSHYKRIESQYDYPVIIGADFWHRLTGDPDFYTDLIEAIGSVAIDSDYSQELQGVIEALAATEEIQKLSNPE